MKKNKILLLALSLVLGTASLMAQNYLVITPGAPNPECDFVYQDIGYHITDSVNRTVEIVYLQGPYIMTGLPRRELALKQNSDITHDVDFNGRDVTIPQEVEHDGVKYTVTAVGEMGFTYPSYQNMNVLTLPPTIKKIGDEAFISAGVARKVVLTGQENIEFGRAILSWSFVEELELSDGIETLHGGDFGFNRYTKRVKLGAGLRSFEGNCFSALVSLKTIDLSPANPYIWVHEGVLFDHDKTRLAIAPNYLKGSFEIPEGTMEIGSYAFDGNAFSDITFPSTLKKICSGAFYRSGCVKAELPEGLEEIESMAFGDEDCLKELTIPSTIRSIGNSAFYGCSKVKAIYCRRAEPLNIGDNNFEYFDLKNCVLYVPKGCVEAYRNTPVWNKFKHIKEEGNHGGVSDIAAPAVQSVKYVNLAGMESDKPFAGLNIVVTTLADGSRRTAKQRF